MFDFTPNSFSDSVEIVIDGRPLGHAVRGHYGWTAQDVGGSIIASQLDTKVDAAYALWGEDGPQAKREKREAYDRSKADDHALAHGDF